MDPAIAERLVIAHGADRCQRNMDCAIRAHRARPRTNLGAYIVALIVDDPAGRAREAKARVAERRQATQAERTAAARAITEQAQHAFNAQRTAEQGRAQREAGIIAHAAPERVAAAVAQYRAEIRAGTNSVAMHLVARRDDAALLASPTSRPRIAAILLETTS